MTYLLVFFAQFFFVLLVGLNTKFLIGNNYFGAFFTSILINICGYFTIFEISKTVLTGDMYTAIAYISGGPLGIITAIHVSKKYTKQHKDQKTDHHIEFENQ